MEALWGQPASRPASGRGSWGVQSVGGPARQPASEQAKILDFDRLQKTSHFKKPPANDLSLEAPIGGWRHLGASQPADQPAAGAPGDLTPGVCGGGV